MRARKTSYCVFINAAWWIVSIMLKLLISVATFSSNSCLNSIGWNKVQVFVIGEFLNFFLAVIPKLVGIAWLSLEHLFFSILTSKVSILLRYELHADQSFKNWASSFTRNILLHVTCGKEHRNADEFFHLLCLAKIYSFRCLDSQFLPFVLYYHF